MRKILTSAISIFVTAATLASAAKTSVMSQYDNYKIMDDNTYGYINSYYIFDFGYAGSTDYQVDEVTKQVSSNAAFGLYSSVHLGLQINLFGMFIRNFKVTITPFNFNPISITGAWTHPIAVSQGEDMTGTLDIGYDLTLGDFQLYYYMNDIVPSVSLMDYIKDQNTNLYPISLKGINAFWLTFQRAMQTAPFGWGWSNEYNDFVMTADPYANFNFGNWLNSETVKTSGNYINTIDFFSQYNEEKNL